MIEYRKAEIKDIDELVQLRIEFMKEAQNINRCNDDDRMEAALRNYLDFSNYRRKA